MGKYALGYGPGPESRHALAQDRRPDYDLIAEFSNSGAVKLERSGYCIYANPRFCWDTFKIGRILQKQHISNTIASCLLSCVSFLQGMETHDLLKIVLPDFFLIAK